MFHLKPVSGIAILIMITMLPAFPEKSAASEVVDEIVEGNSDFAFELYQELAGDSDDENLLFSPYTVSVAFAMTCAGARNRTRAEIADTMNFTLPPDSLHEGFHMLDVAVTGRESIDLCIANSLWSREDHHFRQDFLDLLKANYGSEVRYADFVDNPENARAVVNDWVHDETRGRIENLIPHLGITDMTRLVLVNAVCFRADWLRGFDVDATREMAFRLSDGGQVMAPMMSMNAEFRYRRSMNFSVIELPYAGGELSMIIILPDIGSFREVENTLCRWIVDEIIERMHETNVDLVLPLFEMDSWFSLKDTLSSMGMVDAFCEECADFSGMDNIGGLFIEDVFHEALVRVDGEGTEAVSAGEALPESEGIMGSSFIADHPFIFLIRDRETGAILFMGRMMDPSTAQIVE